MTIHYYWSSIRSSINIAKGSGFKDFQETRIIRNMKAQVYWKYCSFNNLNPVLSNNKTQSNSILMLHSYCDEVMNQSMKLTMILQVLWSFEIEVGVQSVMLLALGKIILVMLEMHVSFSFYDDTFHMQWNDIYDMCAQYTLLGHLLKANWLVIYMYLQLFTVCWMHMHTRRQYRHYILLLL